MSAYGAGAPTYDHAELQKFTISGRLELARKWSNQYRAKGDIVRAERWSRTADELLDRLLEVRGR
jgi:hypothetical protein